MYSLKKLAHYVSLEEIPSSWKNCFEDIKKKYNLNWLDDYNFDEIISYYGFDKHFKERIFKEISILKQDNMLNFICFIMYYILFLANAEDYYDIWSWKSTIHTFKDNGSYTIPIIALLCGYKFHISNMRLRKFDKEQIELQKYNIRLTCTNDTVKYNINGIRFSQMIWGSFFMKGHLIQIGRLQYEIGIKNFDRLNKYFQEEVTYIYIHIPKGKDLIEKDVDNSLNLSSKYIKEYYPELENKKLVYYTETWLLSPEIKEILPINSNIMKFQNKFTIVEYKEYPKDFLNFVFNVGLRKVQYEKLEENTLLQRGLKRMLIENKSLHLGIGFLKENFSYKSCEYNSIKK